MAASLLSGSAGDEPTASVVVGAGLAIVRPVMSWKGRFNSKILLPARVEDTKSQKVKKVLAVLENGILGTWLLGALGILLFCSPSFVGLGVFCARFPPREAFLIFLILLC